MFFDLSVWLEQDRIAPSGLFSTKSQQSDSFSWSIEPCSSLPLEVWILFVSKASQFFGKDMQPKCWSVLSTWVCWVELNIGLSKNSKHVLRIVPSEKGLDLLPLQQLQAVEAFWVLNPRTEKHQRIGLSSLKVGPGHFCQTPNGA